MISRTSSIRPTILTIAALAAVLQTGSRHVAADGGDDQLKWTPHRASTARADFDPAEGGPLAATDTGPDDVALSGPPASVALPDDVPVASPPPRMVRTVSAPRASRPAPARPAEGGFMNRVYDPRNPDALFGVRVIRTPQPPAKAARSIADTQARGPRPASGDTRLGGGLAPRYPTDDADAARQRPERLAMNVDGIPSVMTQAPQVGGSGPVSNCPTTAMATTCQGMNSTTAWVAWVAWVAWTAWTAWTAMTATAATAGS